MKIYLDPLKLKEHMEACGIETYKELAEISGIAYYDIINRVCKNGHVLSFKIAYQLAITLNCYIEELIRVEKEEK